MFDLYQTKVLFNLVDEQHSFFLHTPSITKCLSAEKNGQWLIVSLCPPNRLVLHLLSTAGRCSNQNIDSSTTLITSIDSIPDCPPQFTAHAFVIHCSHESIIDVCFTSDQSDLLVLTSSGRLLAIPIFQILSIKVQSNELYDDGRVICQQTADTPTTVCSYYSFENEQEIAIVATQSGHIHFIAFDTGSILNTCQIPESIQQLHVSKDRQSIGLLITSLSSKQWRLVLEKRNTASNSSLISNVNRVDLSTMETIDDTNEMILDQTIESNHTLFSCLLSKESTDPSAFKHVPMPLMGGSLMSPCKSDNEKDRCRVILQKPFIFNLAFGSGNSFVNLSVFDLNTYEYRTITPLARYALPCICLDEQRPLIALTDRFILTANRKILYLISRQHSDFRRISHDNQIVCQLMFDQEIVHFFSAEQFALNKPSRPVDFMLDSLLIMTTNHLYECTAKHSCLDLFIHVLKQTSFIGDETLQQGENCLAIAQQFLFSLKLPANAFFEQAALHFLKERDFAHAFRLFSAAGTRTLNRLMHCIRLGFMTEAITCIEQTLSERTNQLDETERAQLSTLLVECLVERYLEKHLSHEKLNLIHRLQRWLGTDLWYNPSVCIKLFVRLRMFDLAETVAVARQQHVQLLKSLLAICGKQKSPDPLQPVVSLETVWRCALHPNIVNAFIELPSVMHSYFQTFQKEIARFSDTLLQMCIATFDPRRPTVRLLLQLIPQIQRQYMHFEWTSSTDSDETLWPSRRDLLNFYFLAIFLRQKHNPISTKDFNKELFDLVDQSISSNVSSFKSDSLIESCQWWKRHFVRPSWICAGSKRSFLWIDRQLFSFGPSFSVSDQCNHQKNNFKPIFSESNTIRVFAMSAGATHAVLITDHGCFAFGRSKYGQLGCGSRLQYSNTPLLIESLPIRGIVQVSCGQYHTLAVHENGSVYSWGWAVHGQLGHGSIENEHLPRAIDYFRHISVQKVSAGYCHSIALDRLGIVYAFGSGMFGQLGDEIQRKCATPQPLINITECVADISGRFFQNVAISSTGRSLYVWGCNPQTVQLKAQCIRRQRLNRSKELASNVDVDRQQTSNNQSNSESFGKNKMDTSHLTVRKIDLDELDGRAIRCDTGSLHTLLLTDTGRVYSWGRGPDGQMGHDCKKELIKPTLISKLEQHHVIDIAAGLDYSLALTNQNELFAWGCNTCGQLGLICSNHANTSKSFEPMSPGFSPSLSTSTVSSSLAAISSSSPSGSMSSNLSGKIVNKLNRRLVNYMRDNRTEMYPVQVTLPSSIHHHESNLLSHDSLENSLDSQQEFTSEVSAATTKSNESTKFDALQLNASRSDCDSNIVRYPVDVISTARLIHHYRHDLDLHWLHKNASDTFNVLLAAFICDLLKQPILSIQHYFKALCQSQTEAWFSDAIKCLIIHFLKFKPFATNRCALTSNSHEIMHQILSQWVCYDLDVMLLQNILFEMYQNESQNFMFGILLFKFFDQPNLPSFDEHFKLKCVQLTLRHIQQSNLSLLMSDPVLELLAPTSGHCDRASPSASSASSSTASTFCTATATFSNSNLNASSTEQTWKNVLRNIQYVAQPVDKRKSITATNVGSIEQPSVRHDVVESMHDKLNEDSETICIDPVESEMYVFSCKHQYGKNFFEKVLIGQLKLLQSTTDLIDTTETASGLPSNVRIWLQKYEQQKNHDLFLMAKCPLCLMIE